MPTASSSKQRTAPSIRSTQKSSSSADDLARNLASKLVIDNGANSKTTSKGSKAKLASTPAPAPSKPISKSERMRAVNSASQGLSTIVQMGWKASAGEVKSTTKERVKKLAGELRDGFVELRKLCPSDDMEVERAALSVVSKLIVLEMHICALGLLVDIHASLANQCETPLTTNNEGSRGYLLSLPISLVQDSPHESLLNVISTYLSQSIIVIFHEPGDDFIQISSSLFDYPTLLAWAPQFIQSLSTKTCDSIFTRTYTALVKGVSNYTNTNNTGTSVPPKDVFSTRIYAASCLLYTSAGTMDPNSFWEQVVKFGLAFARSGTDAASETARVACKAYSDMVDKAQVSEASQHFLTGPGYIAFCEQWTKFAKKASELETLGRISKLMSKTPSSSSPDKVVPKLSEHLSKGQLSKTSRALQCAQIGAGVAQAVALFEKDEVPTEEQVAQTLHPTTQSIQDLANNYPSSDTPLDDEQDKALSKVLRSLDGLRRVASHRLENGKECPAYLEAELKGLLNSSADVFSGALSHHSHSDQVARLLETLFVLARTMMVPNEPQSCAAAHGYLERASKALDNIRTSTKQPDAANLANSYRCISQVHYYLAAKLYQDGRHASAIQFLEGACKSGQISMGLKGQSDTPSDDTTKESWKQLEEQLYRRWELLGVCHSKIGNRSEAYEAFLNSIRAFPYTVVGLEGVAAKSTLSEAFNESPAIRQLGVLIDRVTYLAVLELLLKPQQVPIRFTLGGPAEGVVGLVLERQAASLKEHLTNSSAQGACRILLREVAEVYKKASMPLRLARVLLQVLNLAYRIGESAALAESSLLSAAEVARAIERHCTTPNLAQDTGLTTSRFQYQAAAHLWLLILLQRAPSPDQTDEFLKHADAACVALRQYVAPEPRRSSIKPRISSPKDVRTTRLRNQTAVRRTTRVPASRTKTKIAPPPPVTPKKNKKALEPLVLQPKSEGSDLPKPDTSTFDDLDGFANLVYAAGHVLGLNGLVLPKIKLLSLIRRLLERQLDSCRDAYITICIELSSECYKLGKMKKARRILTQTAPLLDHVSVSDEISTYYLIKQAELLASSSQFHESANSYCEALNLAEKIPAEDKNSPTLVRLRERVKRIIRSANAAYVYSQIQIGKEDATASLNGLLQSLRLWNRAVDTLARFSVSSPKQSANSPSDPFLPPESTDSQGVVETPKMNASHISHSPFDGIEWQVSEGLLETLSLLSKLYFRRGSPREAEYFAQQAQDLSTSLHLPLMTAHALGLKAEVYIVQERLEQAQVALLEASNLLHSNQDLTAVFVEKLMGDLRFKGSQISEADELYERAEHTLSNLDNLFGSVDEIVRASRDSIGPSAQGKEILAPVLLARVLKHRILLRRTAHSDTISALLDSFLALPKSTQIQVEENALMAKLSLDNVYQQFKSDMFLSSIHESTISLPKKVHGERNVPYNAKECFTALDGAEKLYLSDLSLVSRVGEVSHVRDSAVSLALINSFQSSLGNPVNKGMDACESAVTLLDFASAVSLRREMSETISSKFRVHVSDDLRWPTVTPTGSSLETQKAGRTSLRFEGEEEDNKTNMESYWSSIRTKYEHLSTSVMGNVSSNIATFPAHWTVVHINITDDKHTLFIARQRGSSCTHKSDEACRCHKDPLMFCVPLKDRREAEGAEQPLSYEDTLEELEEIVRLSDDSARCAINVKNDGNDTERKKWWKDRMGLDERMKTLLENMEFCWLGAFKSILSPQANLSVQDMQSIRSQFATVIFRSLFPMADKRTKQGRSSIKNALQSEILDDALIECFSSLSPKCRDEELEDLVYFILDLYQFHGAPIALSEVDVDQIVVDLRGVLEDCATKRSIRSMNADTDEHIFLILDKNLQSIPWESMPILRGRSVSRVPSLEFLRDRIDLAQLHTPDHTGVVDRIEVDPRKVFYILNPSGDLTKTEGRFRDWLKSMESAGWQGICGRAPSELQLLNALSRNDLMIYFGHGGGEQYARSHKIRGLQSCASTMLWGCSSGALKDMGEFDRVGTPYNYMMAGCPSLVANLWDVTDRDIDKFSQSVFDMLQLSPQGLAKGRPDGSKISIVRSVARSREACKLKYLTGAAPVVYGIPFYI